MAQTQYETYKEMRASLGKEMMEEHAKHWREDQEPEEDKEKILKFRRYGTYAAITEDEGADRPTEEELNDVIHDLRIEYVRCTKCGDLMEKPDKFGDLFVCKSCVPKRLVSCPACGAALAHRHNALFCDYCGWKKVEYNSIMDSAYHTHSAPQKTVERTWTATRKPREKKELTMADIRRDCFPDEYTWYTRQPNDPPQEDKFKDTLAKVMPVKSINAQVFDHCEERDCLSLLSGVYDVKIETEETDQPEKLGYDYKMSELPLPRSESEMPDPGELMLSPSKIYMRDRRELNKIRSKTLDVLANILNNERR
jgi:DNA-directed RNA polymerase subunit M/transcription elongation factor TFIIS